MSLPKGHFQKNNLTVLIGNSIKGYTIRKCIQVPPYQKRIQIQECLGNGWKGETKNIYVLIDNNFIILDQNDLPIGVLIDPYQNNIKSDIYPTSSNILDEEIKIFLKTLTLKQ